MCFDSYLGNPLPIVVVLETIPNFKLRQINQESDLMHKQKITPPIVMDSKLTIHEADFHQIIYGNSQHNTVNYELIGTHYYKIHLVIFKFLYLHYRAFRTVELKTKIKPTVDTRPLFCFILKLKLLLTFYES